MLAQIPFLLPRQASSFHLLAYQSFWPLEQVFFFLFACPDSSFRLLGKHLFTLMHACHSFSLLKQASSLFFSCLAIILPLRQAFPDFLACLTARFSFLGSYSCLKVTASFIKIPIRQ